MASEPNPWSFGDFFRQCLPWTRRRTISNASSDVPEPRLHLPAGASTGSPSMAIPMTSSTAPLSNNTGAGVLSWRALTQALHGLESSLKVFPQLKNAVGGLVDCVERVQLAQQNQDEYRQLASDLATLVGNLQARLPDEQPTRMPFSISNVAQAISEQSAYLREKQERHAAMDFIMAKEDNEDMVDISLSTWTLTHKHWVDTQLKDLAPAHEAFYNSNSATEMQRNGCTENTRTDILNAMQDWVRDPDAANIYWMNGMAGTGKTTIAYSLCERLEADNRLGGSFFCFRNSPNCQDVNRIIPTIAYQLGHYSNPYQAELCRILDKELDVARRKVDVQFKKLILEPIMKVKDALPCDIVVVMDALDECADSNGMRLVLDLLLQHTAELPLKFFITSRPEPIITSKIARHDSKSRSVFYLHDIEESLVQADIQAYLADALAPISPDSAVIEQLAARAGCLFIFAATVVRYIAPQNPSLNHSKRLTTMLQATSTAEQGNFKEVDDLYSTILSKALEDKVLEDGEKEMRRLALWTAICAREPQGASTLAEIFDIEGPQELEKALEPLRSVLHVSQTNGFITTLHASFSDFLLSDKRAGRFACNKMKHEMYLASQSFKIMAKRLRFNICSLESSYTLDRDIPDLETRVGRAISPGLSYACKYWGDHLSQTETPTEIKDLLEEFLKRRLLFWMEVLNLQGWMGRAENMLTQVLTRFQKNEELTELRQFVYDVRNFVTSFTTSQVSLSTPHIYVSALPFTSEQSKVWLHYHPWVRRGVSVEGVITETRGNAALALWSTGSGVGGMALSPDGQVIVSGLQDSTIAIWDVSKGTRTVEPLRGHQKQVCSIAISSDGTRIASGSEDCTVIIWHAEIGSIIAGPLHGHEKLVSALTFSPNGSSLVSGSEDHTIRMWDGHNGTWLGKLFRGHDNFVMSAVFSPDGLRIASGSDDRTIRVWDPETCTTIAGPFVGHTSCVNGIMFSPDGQRIVSGSCDRTVRVWDSYSGEMVAGPFEGHTDRVQSVAFSLDGARVASGSFDSTVCVWDSQDGRLLAGPFDGHRDDVNAVLFSLDGTRVYSGSNDRTIGVWDARDGATGKSKASGHTDLVQCAVFSPDGTRVASGSSDFTIYVWDSHSGALIAGPFIGHTDEVLSVAFSPDGARIVSGSEDHTLRTWDASTGASLADPYEGHTGPVLSVTFSPDGSQIASGSDDTTIRVFSSKNGASVAEPFSGHTETVNAVAFSPRGTRIVSGSDDTAVRMWGATDGSLVWMSDAHTNPVLCATFSPDGTRVVSGSDDCTVLVLDANDGAVLHGPFTGPSDEAFFIAISPDAASAVSVSLDRTVHVWDAQSGRTVAGPLRDYGGQISSVAFSPDGARVVSGWDNGIVRVWDMKSAVQRTALSLHDGPIDNDGWLIDSASQRVVWVPSDLRYRISLPSPFDSVVMGGSCTIRIDEASLLGNRWTECYDASQSVA